MSVTEVAEEVKNVVFFLEEKGYTPMQITAICASATSTAKETMALLSMIDYVRRNIKD